MKNSKAGPLPGGVPLAVPVETVGAYFERQLGEPLEDPDPAHPASPYHAAFTVETGCGFPCRLAIDAAAQLIAHNRHAFGRDDLATEAQLIGLARAVVRCYVYG